LALGLASFYGVAIGIAITVGLTMLASITLLPALLRVLGYKVLPRRIRQAVRDGSYQTDGRPTRWAQWAKTVRRHRLVLGGTAIVIIAVLSIPALSMRLGLADESTDPTVATSYKGYQLIS